MSYGLEEIKGLKEYLLVLTEKITRLRGELLYATDVTQQMKYEKELAQAEEQKRQAEVKLSQAYNIATPSGQSLLDEALQEFLKIDKHLGPYYLVNCDRKERRNDFWNSFDDFKDHNKHFQFYFITACDTQMPQYFAERMIYEVIEEELGSDNQAILLNRDGERVQMEEFPIKLRLENSQKEFKSYFSRRFGFKENESFDEFLEKGIPQIGYDFVATVFRITEGNWSERCFPEYLEWILRCFSKTHEQAPTFLFYFVFIVKGMHESIREKQQALLNTLEKLEKQYDDACLIRQFDPVSNDDLEDWIDSLGQDNPSKRKDLIDAYVRGLDPHLQERFRRDGNIDMDRVMRFQEEIYKWYHRKNSSSL